MANAAFDDFIRRQRADEEEARRAFDSDQHLQVWKDQLKQLYQLVEQFMAPYVARKDATISYEDIEINEEFSGPYVVQQLRLIVARSTILMKPIGTMLIGSSGRVDLVGPRGTARVGLVDRDVKAANELIRVTIRHAGSRATAEPYANRHSVDWTWKIITPAPRMRFIDLTAENFFDMLLGITDA